tara:strand:- start:27982 stop:28248 length:267 start_codon:yes stop_codon:yes gene_type:complete
MAEVSETQTAGDEKASNLRAIFEILSYIHVDAQRDDYTELADRIDFALNLAERMIKSNDSPAASKPGQPEEQTAPAPVVPGPAADGAQ